MIFGQNTSFEEVTQLSVNSSLLFLGLEKERQVVLKMCNQSHGGVLKGHGLDLSGPSKASGTLTEEAEET